MPIESVGNTPWVETWLALREKLGLVVDVQYPLLTTPMANGQWGTLPMGATEAGNWLRSLVSSAGVRGQNLGTHSAKVTVLSWAAKAGLSHAARRLLGYHAKAGDQSMLTYSRDAMARPLRELVQVLNKISSGSTPPAAAISSIKPDGNVQPLEDSDSSSSSEASLDEDEQQLSEEEKACDDVIGDWAGDEASPDKNYARHKFTRCLHVFADSEGTAAAECGL